MARVAAEARRLDIQSPALGRAAFDRLHHFARVHAGFLREDEQFTHRDHLRGNHDLVGSFGYLTRTRVAHMSDRFAHGLEYGHGFFQRGCLTADHDGKGGVARADIPAGNGRIQRKYLLLSQLLRDPARRGRLDR